jgi:hypothetical protein
MDKSVGVGTVRLVDQLSLTFNESEYVAYQHRHSNMKLINYNKSVWLGGKLESILVRIPPNPMSIRDLIHLLNIIK